jgi:hypothetical protein
MSDMPKLPALDLRRSGSDVEAQAEEWRRWNNAMYDVLIGWAHDMEKALRQSEGGNPFLLGADKWAAAKRTVRPIKRAAQRHRYIAGDWIIYKHLFAELFRGTSRGRHGSGHRIDVSR